MITGKALLGIFNLDQASPALSTGDTLLLYKSSVAQADKETERLRRDPVIKRELAMLDKAIAKAKTPGDLLRDPRALAVLLQGLGLGDQAQGMAGLARAALLSDTSKSDALAARLPDSRWRAAAQRLSFAADGLSKLRDPAILQQIRDGVIEYRRVSTISERSRAVADAIYVRQFQTATEPTVYGVLGDAVLRRVATTVAGLPRELAVQSVEAQARSLSSRFDVRQFGDPKDRDALIQRYLVMATSGDAASQPQSPLLSLFA